MTAQQLFNLTVGIMGITPANATSYSDVIIPQMNTILAETYTLENNVRDHLGLSLLTTIPTVSALTDTLTYQDDVLRNVVSYGLAQLLSVSDDEYARANYFGDKYETGRRMVKKVVEVKIADLFDGGAA